MKSSIFIKLFLAALCFFTWNSKVFALAGFSEISSVLHYNNFADIMWGHPSDGCFFYGHYCFYIIEKNKIDHPFSGAIRKINIPESKNNPFVFMEDMKNRWIIYDLELKGILFESDDFGSAYKKWSDWNFPELKFADTLNLSDYFEETEESKEKNKMAWTEFFFLLVGIVFYLHWKFWLGISLIVCLHLFLYLSLRKQKFI